MIKEPIEAENAAITTNNNKILDRMAQLHSGQAKPQTPSETTYLQMKPFKLPNSTWGLDTNGYLKLGP